MAIESADKPLAGTKATRPSGAQGTRLTGEQRVLLMVGLALAVAIVIAAFVLRAG